MLLWSFVDKKVPVLIFGDKTELSEVDKAPVFKLNMLCDPFMDLQPQQDESMWQDFI